MRIVLDKPVNLAQLDAEIGQALALPSPPGLSQNGDVLVVDDELDEATVKKVVAAHVPDPAFGQPAEVKRARELANRTTAFTSAERDEAIKLLLSRAFGGQ